MNRSFMVFSITIDNASPSNALVGGEIASTTTLNFERDGSAGTATIKWQVFEFASGVTVQHGSSTNVGNTAVGITAVDLTKSFVIATGRNDGSQFGSDDSFSANLTTTTNLQLVCPGNTYTEVFWQVVQYDDVIVKKITGSIAGGSTSGTSTITPAVTNLAKTMVISNHTISGNVNAADLPRTELTNATTVTYTRTGNVATMNFVTYVVEFTDPTTVTRGTQSFASTVTTQNASISASTTTSGIISPGNHARQGSTSFTAADNVGHVWFTYEITSNSNLLIERATGTTGGNSTAEAPWQIVTFSNIGTTYYSFASGAWESNSSWSLTSDGSSGAVAAGDFPSMLDNVVIRSGHNITINNVADNGYCGISPNNLNRSNVSTFTGSGDAMFYHLGDIIISNGGILTSTEEVMLEGYTHIDAGGTLNVNEDIVNLGYLEVSASTTFSNTDDLILSGNSITIINNTSTGFDDIYIDHTNATLCGTGVMNIGNGSPDPTIQYFNGASLNQICSSFTVTCSTNCPGGFPMTGTGNFSSGNSGPGGVGDQNTNEIWLMADKGAYTDAGITLAADLNTVQRWHDNSGNGRNAFQNTAGNRPIYRTGQDNGFPALQFTGNLFIDSPSLGIAGTSDLTYFITFKDTQTGLGGINDGGGHYILDRTTATNELMSLKPITGNVYTLQKRSNAGTGLGGPASTTVINTNIKWVEMTRDNGTAYNFFYNGVSESSLADGDGNLTPPAMRIGRHATSNNGGLRGFIHELFVYSSLVNNAQRVLINNYLSAKYGVSLSVNDVYTMDNPVNGDYDAEVAGIGQSSDGSYHKDAKGNGVVRMWNPKGLSNSEFLMWGHDNTALNSSTTAVGTAVDGTVIQERLSRIWRVSETGDVGTVSISFDFSGVGGSPLGSNLRLLIDRDGDGFADNDVTPIAGSVSNGIAVFSNVNFQNGDRFTLGNTDASSPLPVELVMFKASPLRDAIKLNWTTASELNNDYFNIERSSDAEQWVSIATIAGVGTTNETNTYETMDYQPIEGVSYYRLKQTDFDGKISFSPIERVDFVGQNSIQVFPNPSDAIFHLANSAQLDIESIKVLNNLGQIVFPVIRKDENIMIDLSHLSSGIYILQVWNGTFLSNARLIKRN
ncbi:MAG TPA: T9SS type A sorting domain-containing protein [Cyclobacteriaceae bacterium]|nr:T9SS type A sorting domain-containing protein [Cyclobacteriaceae bacterium]